MIYDLHQRKVDKYGPNLLQFLSRFVLETRTARHQVIGTLIILSDSSESPISTLAAF